MTNNKEHIKKVLKSIVLSEDEKTSMRARLAEYAALKPIRTEETERMSDDIRQHTQTPESRLHMLIYKVIYKIKTMPIIAGLLIVVFAGGGTSLAAEQAVPGDALYPIKTEVNETVRGALTFNTEAKARWEARLAERRLEEGEKLTARGEFSEEQKARIESNFKAHAERTQERIDRIAETDPALAAELSSRFEVALNAHETILAQIEAGDGVDVSSLKAHIHAHAGTVGTLRVQAVQHVSVGTDVDLEVAAEQMRAAAEKSLDETERLLARLKGKLDAEQYARAEAELESAANLFIEAEAELAAEDYRTAFARFRTVLSMTHHLSVFLKSGYLGEVTADERVDGHATSSEQEHRERPMIHITPLPSVFVDTDGQTTIPTKGSANTTSDESSSDETETSTSVEVETETEVETDGSTLNVDTETSGGINVNL